MKLLATDMDGTFLRDDKSYSEEFNDLYKQMLKKIYNLSLHQEINMKH